MSESPYVAMREFIRLAVELDVRKATQPLHDEVRSLRTQLETRSAPQVIEGPPGPAGKDGAAGSGGKDGRDGKDGAPGTGEKGERGADGINGKDGAPSTVVGPKGDTGERGANGIATREEIIEIVEQRAADISVRTFADTYKGVYKPGELYTRGVLTTWGGSLFLAKADTKAKPGESPDWQLVAKRGADGKDVGNRR